MKFKIYFLLLTIAISTTASLAQPIIGLQKTIGGSGDDVFTCMSLTKDSGLIIGGYSNSDKSGNKLENSKGGYDFWILLLNNKGALLSQKTIGGNSDERLSTVEQTDDGGYILGGFSYSNISGDKTENSRGSYDFWIVKLDSGGNIQWDKTIGGSEYDELTGIKQTGDGGYIASGYSFSDASGDKTENGRGGFDYWVVKLDAGGNMQWDKTIGGSGYDRYSDMIITNDDGYLIGGCSSSGISGEKTDSSRGVEDYWIVKLDNAGNIQWDKTYGGNQFDVLSALLQTSDGGYLLGGYSSSGISGEKMQPRRGPGSCDYWIVKTDHLGQIQWSNTFGGDKNDFLASIEPVSDGGYMLGGYSKSNISGEKTEKTRGGDDYWIIKLSRNGTIQWDKTIGGSKIDNGAIIKETGRNRYIVAGYSTSGIGRDKTAENKGISPTNDYWLVELNYSKPDSALAVAALENKNGLQLTTDKSSSNFSVYPNPAKDVLHIKTDGKTSFSLTSQSGKIILAKTITNSGDMDISKVQPGVYFLSNQTKTVKQKIVINR